MNKETKRDLKGILGEVKSELPDTDETKLAKKRYFDLPMAVAKLRDLADSLSNMPESPNQRAAIDDMAKALKLLDKAGDSMRLLGLHKA